MNAPQKRWPVILMLGALTTISPFSIDMYLAAFPQIAGDLGTSTARIALSLSSYFLGLAFGQIAYGPFLDRYGRKRPLYFGLILYIVASIGCLRARSVESLIAFRFLQALGGSAAEVGALAMVRDFFPAAEGAKILSLMMLILGVSPLLAPTVGGWIVASLGWQTVFWVLSAIVGLILLITRFWLPESHRPDPTVSLRPLPILRAFGSIVRHPQFSTYAFAGAFSFTALFVYVAGSPAVFMDLFHLSAHAYGGVFAFLACGFIGSSQLNIWLLRRFTMERIFRTMLGIQCAVSLLFAIGAWLNVLTLGPTIALFFVSLSCVGMSAPNATTLALQPFTRNAGSAAALIGFLQIGIAATASAGIGLFPSRSLLPSTLLLVASSWVGYGILIFGTRAIARRPTTSEEVTL